MNITVAYLHSCALADTEQETSALSSRRGSKGNQCIPGGLVRSGCISSSLPSGSELRGDLGRPSVVRGTDSETSEWRLGSHQLQIRMKNSRQGRQSLASLHESFVRHSAPLQASSSKSVPSLLHEGQMMRSGRGPAGSGRAHCTHRGTQGPLRGLWWHGAATCQQDRDEATHSETI